MQATHQRSAPEISQLPGKPIVWSSQFRWTLMSLVYHGFEETSEETITKTLINNNKYVGAWSDVYAPL